MSWKRFLAGFDLHGDKQDDDTVERFLDFSKIWKPHKRIFGGDLWDFRAIRKKAGEDERRDSMTEDYNCGMKFLREWEPHVFLRGNHDERLWDAYFNGIGPLKDLASDWIEEINAVLKRLKCTQYPWDKRKGIHYEGHLKVIHGFFIGETACKRHAQVYGSVIHGHTHGVDEAGVAGLEKRVGRACGCLCQLDYDYNRGNPLSLRHKNGWAYGIINDRTGDYHIWQAEEINGQWILPTNVITL